MIFFSVLLKEYGNNTINRFIAGAVKSDSNALYQALC